MSKFGNIILNNEHYPELVAITNVGNSGVQLNTGSGYLQLGPLNTSHCHFQTDRPNFYFNTGLNVNTGLIDSYDEDLQLRRAGSTTARLRITAGTTISDQALLLTSTLTLPDKIIHSGDTDTYFEFQAANQARIVAGNAEITEWRADRMQMSNKPITFSNWNNFSDATLGDINYASLNAPIHIPAVNVGSADKYLPILQGSAQHTQGYRTSYVFGAFKQATAGAGWGDGQSGFFMGMGGSDAVPTKEFRFTWDGRIWYTDAGAASYLDFDTANTLKFVADNNETLNLTSSTATINGDLTLATENSTGDNSIHLPRGGEITFYGDTSSHHSIASTNHSNSVTDDMRISSYGAVYIDLDSNANNTSGADFVIARHNATANLFKVDGETGTGYGIHSYPNAAADGVSLSSYTQGTVPIAQGVVQIRSTGKTGWDNGDEMGSIDFYNNDGSGVAARTLARMVAVNSQGNGTSTTTFNGEIHFYTSPYNAALNSAPVMRLTESNSVIIGDGTDASSHLEIRPADDGTADDIQFYNGSTRMGEIGTQDTTWLRINQSTAKNIYTPRYIRADSGFFVDDTTKGINGSGNFIGGTITGASDANVSNWDTAHGWGNHASAGYTSNVGDITGVTAGNGLTGGATSGVATVTVGAGDGISVTSTTVTVDSTVIRTTGNQSISGVKTHTSQLALSSGQMLSLGDTNHHLVKVSTGYSGATVDGPRLQGHQGGELATNITSNQYALRWDASGNITVRNNIVVYGTVDGVDIQTLNTTANAALPKAGGTMTGTITAGGGINMANTNITSVNHLTFNDSGVNEGLEWSGGSGWKIFESPDALTNAAGNLQFVTGSTRRFGITTGGYIGATRIYAAVDRSCGYFYNDTSTRTAYTGGDFYIQADVGNFYNYATNTYLGNTSGDTIHFRTNTVTATNWGISTGGDISVANKIIHNGDTDTYMSFDAADQWKLYCGAQKMIQATEASSGYDYVSFGGTDNSGEILFNVNGGDGHFDGDIYAYSTTTSSDRKLKKNIQLLEGSLEKVLNLRGVSFQWKKDDKKSIGFIAQEVQEVVPDLVKNNRKEHDGELIEEHLGVDYGNITALLVEAVKEQQALINRLEERIKTLESKSEK